MREALLGHGLQGLISTVLQAFNIGLHKPSLPHVSRCCSPPDLCLNLMAAQTNLWPESAGPSFFLGTSEWDFMCAAAHHLAARGSFQANTFSPVQGRLAVKNGPLLSGVQVALNPNGWDLEAVAPHSAQHQWLWLLF